MGWRTAEAGAALTASSGKAKVWRPYRHPVMVLPHLT
jgi:hypothetical protein